MIQLRRSADGAYVLRARQWLPRTPAQLFGFFADCRHMNAVIPPWMRFEILSAPAGPMRPGARYEYILRWRWLRLRWRTRITACQPPFRFVDVQERGPYRSFEHEHRFEPAEGGTLTHDLIRYRPPGGVLSPLINRWALGGDLVRLFAHRHQRMAQLFPAGVDLSNAGPGA